MWWQLKGGALDETSDLVAEEGNGESNNVLDIKGCVWQRKDIVSAKKKKYCSKRRGVFNLTTNSTMCLSFGIGANDI